MLLSNKLPETQTKSLDLEENMLKIEVKFEIIFFKLLNLCRLWDRTAKLEDCLVFQIKEVDING